MAEEALPRPLVRDQCLAGVAKALEAWSRLWGHDHGYGGVAKALGAWSRPRRLTLTLRPWGVG